jgi:putative transposase
MICNNTVEYSRFSNYGSYDQLTNDGLTQWHPAFLQLGNSLEECARKYRGFCKRYNPKSKPARKCHWGNKLLAGLDLKGGKRSGKPQTLTTSSAPPTPSSPLNPNHRCQVSETPMVSAIAAQFIRANQAPRGEERHF